LYFKKFSARVNASSSIVSLKENLKIRQLIATENAYDPTKFNNIQNTGLYPGKLLFR